LIGLAILELNNQTNGSNTAMAKSKSVKWTREHMLVALNVYDKLPFGKFDKGNRLIIDLAGRMGRTPSSLAMKLSNFASLDPFHKARGVRGLEGATKTDKAIWQEYREKHDTLAEVGEELFADLCGENEVLSVGDEKKPRIINEPQGPLEKYLPKKVRVGQRYFRQIVLNAYGERCALTGLGIRSLLVASHIVPWSQAAKHRLDVRNGIALNALHDKAFDRGLITFDTALRLVCAPSLRDLYTAEPLAQNFKAFEGRALTLPAEAAGPKAEYLEWHRKEVFGKKQ
jgi:putative restriction endonuclease